MRAICTSDSFQHNPQFEFDNGRLEKAWEVPDRSNVIRQAIQSLSFIEIEECRQICELQFVSAVHNSKYLNWLNRQSADLKNNEVIYPSVFPFGAGTITENAKGQRGQFCFDTYTPIFHDTYKIALHSAATALSGAKLLTREQEKYAYALCRPPGHHAETARCGGYCYFNNTAIAANYLSQNGSKVAVLDVDIHHGNGTQNIFWESEAILTVSIHCSPDYLYPYFSGYENEIGSGKGIGKNINIPLSPKASEIQYQSALETSLERIETYKPDFIVVALGVDTHQYDPIGNFTLTTPYYKKMAKTINQLNRPVLVVQEGGYSLEHLGESVASFLSGFSE